MAGQFVSVERRPDGVALLRLDRPKMNALSIEVLRQLTAAAGELNAEPPGAVVVWGGERIFAAGADVEEFAGPEAAAEIGGWFRRALDGLASVPRATIAAVNGYALGGGCELALACDFRVVADNARLGQPEVMLGIIPGGGGTQRLPRLLGPARAKDLVLSGRQVHAEEALRIGLADRVVAAGRVLDEALEWAAAFASGAVVAQGRAKRGVDEGGNEPLRRGLDLEQELFAEAFSSEDARIGIDSFRRQGPGKARFTGR